MENPGTYLPIPTVVELTGVPQRTLEAWIAAGLVSTLVGKRARLVRVGDVRTQLALMQQNSWVPPAPGSGSQAGAAPDPPRTRPRRRRDDPRRRRAEAAQPDDQQLRSLTDQLTTLRNQLATREVELAELSQRLTEREGARSESLAASGHLAGWGRANAVGIGSRARRAAGAASRAAGPLGLVTRAVPRAKWPRAALAAALLIVPLLVLLALAQGPSPTRTAAETRVVSVPTSHPAGQAGVPAETQAAVGTTMVASNDGPTPTPAPPAVARSSVTPSSATPAAVWQPTAKLANWGVSINFRSGPSTTSSVRRVLPPGTSLRYLNEQQSAGGITWMHFDLQDGTDGWVRSIDVVPLTASPTPQTGSRP